MPLVGAILLSRSPQLAYLALQLGDPDPILGRRPRPHPGIDLGQLQPVAERLVVDVQLLGYLADSAHGHTARLTPLAHQPDILTASAPAAHAWDPTKDCKTARGYVVGPYGHPLAGANVRVSALAACEGQPSQVVAAGDGSYTIRFLGTIGVPDRTRAWVTRIAMALLNTVRALVAVHARSGDPRARRQLLRCEPEGFAALTDEPAGVGTLGVLVGHFAKVIDKQSCLCDNHNSVINKSRHRIKNEPHNIALASAGCDVGFSPLRRRPR